MNAAETNIVVHDAQLRLPSFDEVLLDRIVLSCIADVEAYAGPPADITEVFTHYGVPPRMISCARPIAEIISVTERRSTYTELFILGAGDYRQLDEHRLVRCRDGTTPSTRWGCEVSVRYDPVVDVAKRQQVVLDLVELEAKFKVFDRAQLGADLSYVATNYTSRRAELLAQLSEGRSVCEVA